MADGGFGAASFTDVAVDATGEAEVVRGVDVDAEIVESAQAGVVEGEDAFDDEDLGGEYGFGAVGDAGVGGEVVDGAGDGLVGGERGEVLDEQGVFEGVGVVEVLLGAVGGGQVAEIAVVEVERKQRGVELGAEFGGEGGLAGAGAACDSKDEGTVREGKLLGNWFGHGYDFRWYVPGLRSGG